MNDTTPALPPLPEQDGWAVEMHGHLVMFARNAEKASGRSPGATTPIFTAEKVRAYALQAVAADRAAREGAVPAGFKPLTDAQIDAVLLKHWMLTGEGPRKAVRELLALAAARVLPLPDKRKRDESELSDWQDGANKPAVEGLYLREFDEGEATTEFKDGEWLRDGFFASDIQDAPWRGLRGDR